MTTDELLVDMAAYPAYEAVLDTPGLAQMFNVICQRAAAYDRLLERAEWEKAAAVAAERERCLGVVKRAADLIPPADDPICCTPGAMLRDLCRLIEEGN